MFSGRRSRLTVWTHHAGAAVSMRLIDRDWLKAGLPLRVTLGRAASLRLKVVGDDWRPIAHARIAPHRVAGQPAPATIADRVAVMTDAKGIAELADFARDELDAVRVEQEAWGIQWISLPQVYDRDLAEFAALIARYDSAVARDVAQPFAGKMRELAAEAQSGSWQVADRVFMARAVSDAHWAYELVQSLPDTPVKPALNPKQSAARVVAGWLWAIRRANYGVSSTIVAPRAIPMPEMKSGEL